VWLAWALVWGLCLGGLAVSCLGLSGTWLVVGAAVAAAFLSGAAFPGLWTVLAFVVLSAAVEMAEAASATWGVKKRGGSWLAGLAAAAGGLGGLLLGSLIPLPVFGSLLGMLAGGFGLAYLVEYRRLRSADRAAHIARGAVVAHVLILLLKVAATLGMSATLLLGVFLD
jgi:uncharacterized protein YqgC (DUF456 family)